MYVFDYLIYQLKPFGLETDRRPATPEPPPDLDLLATPWYAAEETNLTRHSDTLVSSRVKAAVGI